MTLSVDHIHHLDRQLVPEGEEHRPMALWVPSERISVHRIEAPSAPRRKWSELIPWILEDRLLQRVEDMHFVIGAAFSVGDKKWVDVTVVSKQDMLEWLRIADNASVTPTALVPDYLAVPVEEGRITAVWREGVLLVRDQSGSGFAAAPALAWGMLRRQLNAAEIAPRLSISIPDETLVPEDLREEADINSAEIDWQFSEIAHSANLVSGEFSTSVKSADAISWIPTAALIVLAVVLCFGYLQVSNSLLEERVDSLENQLSDSFGNVFVGKRARPEKVRVSGEKLMEILFKQQQSVNAPAMRALINLEKNMTACNCDLISMSVVDSRIEFELESADKLSPTQWRIPGYKITSEKNETVTSITLVEVSKP